MKLKPNNNVIKKIKTLKNVKDKKLFKNIYTFLNNELFSQPVDPIRLIDNNIINAIQT